MFKSKTMMFSFALALLSTLQLNTDLLQQLIRPEHFGYVTLVISVAVAALRWVTTQPLSEK